MIVNTILIIVAVLLALIIIGCTSIIKDVLKIIIALIVRPARNARRKEVDKK